MNLFAAIGKSACALAIILSSGCKVLSEKNIATDGPGHLGIVNKCGETWDKAQNCAQFVMEALGEREQMINAADNTVAGLNVAAGTLAAIYAKSATDRSQAIEDLGVTIGAINGFRKLARLDEKRKIAVEARAAVECVWKAARATIEKADVGTRQVVSNPLVPRFTAGVMVNGNPYVAPSTALKVDWPVQDATLTRLSILLDDRVNSLNRARTTTKSIALQMAGTDCRSNSQNSCLAARKLAEGIAEIVREARSAFSKPAGDVEKLHETQRKLVEEQIGALVSSLEEEAEQKQEVATGAALAPLGATGSAFFALKLAEEDQPQADPAILQTYADCVQPK